VPQYAAAKNVTQVSVISIALLAASIHFPSSALIIRWAVLQRHVALTMFSSSPRKIRYRMVSTKDDSIHVDAEVSGPEADERGGRVIRRVHSRLWSHLGRQTYYGSLLFNLGAFFLPALYSTLSKLWVADLNSSQVVTTDVYTYIGVVANVLNDGLPRTAWLIIGDKSTRRTNSRISLAYTLIIFQVILGAILTVVFVASSKRLAAAFVPEAVRQTSITYVRISSVEALSSAMEVAVACSTRALDHPDVPLLISSTKFIVNIVLDLLIISRFHVGSFTPTINTQALIRMACDLTSAVSGLAYFLHIAIKMQQESHEPNRTAKPSILSLKILVRPGMWTFLESALRNSIYLWLVSGIVSMGLNYATAWGVFNTIRWGIVMVPVQALEASTLTFVGHAWGRWRAQVGPEVKKPKATKKDLLAIMRPAFTSLCIALAVEVPLCIFLSLWGIKEFAYYLSNSDPVAEITQKMWKTIDWCYIFYALNYQLAAILLATVPRWYLYQALGSNLLWMLPWAITVTRIGMTAENAWSYDSIIFGGALVFDFFNVSLVCCLWAWQLKKGKIPLVPVRT
jgi:Na+-driven multidrug efflux pump